MKSAVLEFEGTWEELASRASDWEGKWLRVTVLPTEIGSADPRLQVLREIEERSRFMNPGVDDTDLLREGRSGGMFGA